MITTIYGVKTACIEDVFTESPFFDNISRFTYHQLNQISFELSDYIYQRSIPQTFHSIGINLFAIPLSIMEEYIYKACIDSSVRTALDFMTMPETRARIRSVHSISDNMFKSKLDSIVDAGLSHRDPHVMIVCSDSSAKSLHRIMQSDIIGIYVDSVDKVIEKINSPQSYVCSECGHCEECSGNDLPPFMYDALNSYGAYGVKYYCNECASKLDKKLAHVGESF